MLLLLPVLPYMLKATWWILQIRKYYNNIIHTSKHNSCLFTMAEVEMDNAYGTPNVS